MRLGWGLVLPVTLLATVAGAQIDPPLVSLDNVTWSAKPSEAELEAAKPRGATTRGYVILKCGVAADGGLSDCTRFLEDPKDEGFLAAAMALVPEFRLDAGPARFAHDAGATVMVQFNWPGEGGPCYPPYCLREMSPAPPPPAGPH